MAPPTPSFPVSEIQTKAQYTTTNFKEKRRKVRDFELEKCALYELVQYSCTTPQQQMQGKAGRGGTQVECWPFVRLFRRCGKGDRMFHVETTAWEGEHMYTSTEVVDAGQTHIVKDDKKDDKTSDSFANYGNYFWSKG